MDYICSYFIEIISQFKNKNKNYGIRCYFDELKIGQGISSSSTIDIKILESQLKESPAWTLNQTGEDKLHFITPVVNDLVRIYVFDGKELRLLIAGLIDKIYYSYIDKIYSIRVSDLQDIGNSKTAKFFSKSNITDDIPDYTKIQYLYKLKLGNYKIKFDEVNQTKTSLVKVNELTRDVDFDVEILNANELKKTRYGFESRGSDTFRALITNTLSKHNLHQFCEYYINGNITQAKIVLNKKPNLINSDNTFFQINFDEGSDFLISYDIGTSYESNSVPQVIQKHYHFPYKADEDSDENARYYIFSDPFFNLGGSEGNISIDFYSVTSYFETEEWKNIKEEIKNYDDVDSFVEEFKAVFTRAKEFLNQVAFRELITDIYNNVKIKITLFGGHKVHESFLTTLGKQNKSLSYFWKVGLGVNFTAENLGYKNKKMVITEITHGSESSTSSQSITLTIVSEEIIGQYNDPSYYSFPELVSKVTKDLKFKDKSYEIAPVLKLLNENDKAFDFFDNSNQVINGVIATMRSPHIINGPKYQAQRDLLSPELRKNFEFKKS